MRAVDTSVLVRLLARDDVEQAERAEAFVRGGAWVSHLVLMESVWVLGSVYDVAPKDLARAVEMLLVHDTLVIQDPEVVRAALADFVAGSSVGFSDWLILNVAKKHGHVPIGTFDAKLSRAPDAARV